MTQQIIVYIIGVVLFAYVGHKIYLALTGRGAKDPCSGCKGCDLKHELDAKKRTCTPNRTTGCGCKK